MDQFIFYFPICVAEGGLHSLMDDAPGWDQFPDLSCCPHGCRTGTENNLSFLSEIMIGIKLHIHYSQKKLGTVTKSEF